MYKLIISEILTAALFIVSGATLATAILLDTGWLADLISALLITANTLLGIHQITQIVKYAREQQIDEEEEA